MGNPVVSNGNGVLRNAKIVVPLKYLSNFFRSLEIPLINCEIHLELNWTKDCVMSNVVGATTIRIQAQNCMFQLSIYQLKIM